MWHLVGFSIRIILIHLLPKYSQSSSALGLHINYLNITLSSDITDFTLHHIIFPIFLDALYIYNTTSYY